jgi:hypothetical protein
VSCTLSTSQLHSLHHTFKLVHAAVGYRLPEDSDIRLLLLLKGKTEVEAPPGWY